MNTGAAAATPQPTAQAPLDTGFGGFGEFQQTPPVQPPAPEPKKEDAWAMGGGLFNLSGLKKDSERADKLSSQGPKSHAPQEPNMLYTNKDDLNSNDIWGSAIGGGNQQPTGYGGAPQAPSGYGGSGFGAYNQPSSGFPSTGQPTGGFPGAAPPSYGGAGGFPQAPASTGFPSTGFPAAQPQNNFGGTGFPQPTAQPNTFPTYQNTNSGFPQTQPGGFPGSSGGF